MSIRVPQCIMAHATAALEYAAAIVLHSWRMPRGAGNEACNHVEDIHRTKPAQAESLMHVAFHVNPHYSWGEVEVMTQVGAGMFREYTVVDSGALIQWFVDCTFTDKHLWRLSTWTSSQLVDTMHGDNVPEMFVMKNFEQVNPTGIIREPTLVMTKGIDDGDMMIGMGSSRCGGAKWQPGDVGKRGELRNALTLGKAQALVGCEVRDFVWRVNNLLSKMCNGKIVSTRRFGRKDSDLHCFECEFTYGNTLISKQVSFDRINEILLHGDEQGIRDTSRWSSLRRKRQRCTTVDTEANVEQTIGAGR